MEANDYQAQAARTLISAADAPVLKGDGTRLLWNALGLAGEAGEFANTVKKLVLHEHDTPLATLADELGDCLWYIAACCSVLDLQLGDVLAGNLTKLRARFPEGWDPARSQTRDVAAEALAVEPVGAISGIPAIVTAARAYVAASHALRTKCRTMSEARALVDQHGAAWKALTAAVDAL